ncbi:MAG TPA: hypothetical protein VG347_05200 [Verrucomicrobiae bacterium]|nr:hypothetical protein [Verrucomicrobiae bacterium]
MLILLLMGSYISVTLTATIWTSMEGVSLVEQVPISCKAIAVFADVIWFATCIVFGKPIAIYASQQIWELGLLFFWPMMRFYNVIMLRRRLVIVVVAITVAMVTLGTLSMRPIYSATCTIKVEMDAHAWLEMGAHAR